MNSQTKLGKAVRAAVEELEHLGDLVRAGNRHWVDTLMIHDQSCQK
jgi:hypothetical protein